MSEETHEKYGIFNCPNCGAAAGPDSVSCVYCGSSLATRVCASCFGAVSVGMHHCPWCGAGTESGKPAAPAVHKCPRCAINLRAVKVGGHEMSECTSCGGLWVGKEAVQQICTREEEQEAVLGFELPADSGGAAKDSGHARVYVPCPECGQLMNRMQFAGCSGVIVDWCKKDGTWFDRQELHQIVRFIRDGGLKKSREREKRMIEDERSRLRHQQSMAKFGLAASDESALMGINVREDADALFRVISAVWKGLEK